jgi:hypothetical protein
MGFRVFRLHGLNNTGCDCNRECSAPGKHPLGGSGWSKRATTDPDTITAWWDRTPGANIGIVTGPAPAGSGIVVLDIDGPEGDSSLTALEREYALLPDTPRVNTGKGYHVYFRDNGSNLRGSIGLLGTGIDVRAAGNYIVGPSSWHVSGATYEWDVGHHPDDLDFAELPEWVIQLMEERRASASSTMSAPGERIRTGERNGRLFKAACRLRPYEDVSLELLHAMLATDAAPHPTFIHQEPLRPCPATAVRA